MRWQYKCPHEKCGNTVPAERVERRVPGTRGQIRVMSPLMCESSAHAEPVAMEREDYVPARREVRE